MGVFHAEVAAGRLNDPANTGEVHPRAPIHDRYLRLVSPPISPLRDRRGTHAGRSLDRRSTIAGASLGRRAGAELALN
jgi:hypothetical protein